MFVFCCSIQQWPQQKKYTFNDKMTWNETSITYYSKYNLIITYSWVQLSMDYLSIDSLDELSSKSCCELSYFLKFYKVSAFYIFSVIKSFILKNNPMCKKSPWCHHELKENLRHLNILKSLFMILTFKISY